jgi:hypothetical protein
MMSREWCGVTAAYSDLATTMMSKERARGAKCDEQSN